jgi:hypothetical protein
MLLIYYCHEKILAISIPRNINDLCSMSLFQFVLLFDNLEMLEPVLNKISLRLIVKLCSHIIYLMRSVTCSMPIQLNVNSWQMNIMLMQITHCTFYCLYCLRKFYHIVIAKNDPLLLFRPVVNIPNGGSGLCKTLFVVKMMILCMTME